jgi:hypothetical protein
MILDLHIALPNASGCPGEDSDVRRLPFTGGKRDLSHDDVSPLSSQDEQFRSDGNMPTEEKCERYEVLVIQ